MKTLTHFSQLTKFMKKHEVYHNINISLKNKYIYFVTAKAACSTIKRTLLNLELNGTNYRPEKVHLDVFASPHVKLFQLKFDEVIQLLNSDDIFKFCFVRNPYTRILSCYIEKIMGNRPQKKKILKVLGKDENILDQPIEFEEFLDVISTEKPKEMDSHWRIQYYQLFGDLIQFDFIGKVENINNDLKVVDSRLGGNILKYRKDCLWHQTQASTRLSDYYNDRIAGKVRDLYLLDFKKFGYSTNWHEV